MLVLFDGRRHRRDAQLDALFVVSLRLHVLRQVPLRLERKATMPASVRPKVGVGPDVFLEHGRLLAADAATVADVPTPTPAPDVGVIVIEAFVATLDGR